MSQELPFDSCKLLKRDPIAAESSFALIVPASPAVVVVVVALPTALIEAYLYIAQMLAENCVLCGISLSTVYWASERNDSHCGRDDRNSERVSNIAKTSATN